MNAKLFQMVLCERSILDQYCPNSDVTDHILNFFSETLHLNLNEEGDKHAQLGLNLFCCLKLLSLTTQLGLNLFCCLKLLSLTTQLGLNLLVFI